MVDRQSIEPDQAKRKMLVWDIEKKLAEDGARAIIFYAPAGFCRQPYVKDMTMMSNSIYNGARMEDVWLDK
jgi:peptide/nickel transport system substrate-binding protein